MCLWYITWDLQIILIANLSVLNHQYCLCCSRLILCCAYHWFVEYVLYQAKTFTDPLGKSPTSLWAISSWECQAWLILTWHINCILPLSLPNLKKGVWEFYCQQCWTFPKIVYIYLKQLLSTIPFYLKSRYSLNEEDIWQPPLLRVPLSSVRLIF